MTEFGAELLQRYRIEQQIGSGQFGKVYLATRLRTGSKRAIKVISKKTQNWERELQILTLLRHPNVLRLHCYFDQPLDCCLVLQYCPGGDLFEYIISQPKQCLEEAEAKRLAAQVLSALEYCQGNLISHRDLKPENVLLDAQRNVKLADFGFAKQTRGSTSTLVGSMYYSAIELFQYEPYNPMMCDAWSFGVLLASMVQGQFPFRVRDEKELRKAFQEDTIPELVLKTITKELPSPDYQALVSKLLVPVDERLPLQRIKYDPWLAGHLVDHRLSPREPTEPNPSLLAVMIEMGFDTDHVADAGRSNLPCPEHAVYHLLAEERLLERKISLPEIKLKRVTTETRSSSSGKLISRGSIEVDSPSPLRRLIARRAKKT